MSDSKKHNSILFLTTLSVYLGLVLVGGASSPVLAQAAMTRNFDIQEEIEYKDELDKKPDDELLVSSIIGIVNNLNEFSKQSFFDWEKRNSFQIEGLNFCGSDNLPSYLGSSTSDSKVYSAIDGNIVALARHIFTTEAVADAKDFYLYGLEFNLSSENKSLNFKFEIKNREGKTGQVYFDQLNHYLTRIIQNSGPTKQKIVAENTKITFENNQILIITNLPRASIDSLLASKDAN